MNDIASCSNDSKKAFKYLEAVGRRVRNNELLVKCFILKDNGGNRSRVSKAIVPLREIEVIKSDSNGSLSQLKDRITELMQKHNPTENEIDQLYHHIIASLVDVDGR